MSGNSRVNAVGESGAVAIVGNGDDAEVVRRGGVEMVEVIPVFRQDDAAEFDGAGKHGRVVTPRAAVLLDGEDVVSARPQDGNDRAGEVFVSVEGWHASPGLVVLAEVAGDLVGVGHRVPPSGVEFGAGEGRVKVGQEGLVRDAEIP